MVTDQRNGYSQYLTVDQQFRIETRSGWFDTDIPLGLFYIQIEVTNSKGLQEEKRQAAGTERTQRYWARRKASRIVSAT